MLQLTSNLTILFVNSPIFTTILNVLLIFSAIHLLKKILNTSNYKLLIKFFIYLLVFLIFFTLSKCINTIYLNCKVSRVINEFNEISYFKQITNPIVAYSPPAGYEEPNNFVGQALEILEMNLTLNLLMLYLIFIVIFVFTFKLLAEKQVNFNFILKLPAPLGQALHSILNKMLSYYTTTSNIWFYFMFACLFIGIAASAFATYGCIILLR